ncbi:hypothetical protein TRIUR3_25077 [Triticum urartu]|uniref:Uncharacterized protein n=1 Tax=Triticum urartu TaxID=4572 RepID=M8AK52_TRIUA|nr:hypothetical protein TRIUR3_25077 [Triticum urartu]
MREKAKAAVVLRVPAGSPMVCSRRQALVRREAAMRRAREAGRHYELIPTACGEMLFTQSWCPHASSSIKPRALVVVMHGLNDHIAFFSVFTGRIHMYPGTIGYFPPKTFLYHGTEGVLWIDLAVAWTGLDF